MKSMTRRSLAVVLAIHGFLNNDGWHGYSERGYILLSCRQ